MNKKYPMAMIGTLLILAGCNQGDGTKSEPSMTAVTNELREAGKDVSVSSLTNPPAASVTNQETQAHK